MAIVDVLKTDSDPRPVCFLADASRLLETSGSKAISSGSYLLWPLNAEGLAHGLAHICSLRLHSSDSHENNYLDFLHSTIDHYLLQHFLTCFKS